MKNHFAAVFTIIIVMLIAVPLAVVSFVSKDKSAPVSEESTVQETVPDKPEETADEPDNTSEPVSEAKDDEPVTLDKYTELLEINPYVYGWLRIDGTSIDDPVVYTPGSQNYFLHRDLDGTPLEKGTFFVAINRHPASLITLIYGHNMKDGSGFGSLQKYADENFGRQHPVIYFDTLTKEQEYELVAAFYSQIDEDELETEEDRKEKDEKIAEGQIDLAKDWGDEDIYRQEKDEDNGRFRYYYFTDLSDKNDYDYFIENVKKNALYDTGVDAQYGDELLMMSTCSYQVKNGRFIVVAKLKQ